MKYVQRLFVLLLLFFYLSGLSACNFPGVKAPTPEFSSDMLRQTLAAQGTGAPQLWITSSPGSANTPQPAAGNETPVSVQLPATPVFLPPATDQYCLLPDPTG